MADNGHVKRKKPTAKVGDIVFAEGCWFLVREKNGHQLKGSLIAPGREDSEYRFTSHRVERVFREMGCRMPRAKRTEAQPS